MAGVRHHILPRFLLKGFASKVEGSHVFTWCYRRNGSVLEISTKDVSVEKHFYGREGELNVDDEITDLEPSFAALVDDLRTKADRDEIQDPRLSEFVAHLSSRTKHIRDTLIDTTSALANELFTYLSSPSNFRYWIGEYYKRHPEVIKKALDDALKSLQIPRGKRLMLRERIMPKLQTDRISELFDSEIPEYALMMGALGSELLRKIPTMAKEGHIKVLAKSLIPDISLEEYKQLHWFVLKSPCTLVLGDIGCLFEVEAAKRFVAISGTENLVAIYLPISTDTLVVATPSWRCPIVDFQGVNESIVKCSREFFVCKEFSEDQKQLLEMLGTESEIFSVNEIHEIAKDIIHNG